MSDDEAEGRIPHEHVFNFYMIRSGLFLTTRWFQCECGQKKNVLRSLSPTSKKVLFRAAIGGAFYLGFLCGRYLT